MPVCENVRGILTLQNRNPFTAAFSSSFVEILVGSCARVSVFCPPQGYSRYLLTFGYLRGRVSKYIDYTYTHREQKSRYMIFMWLSSSTSNRSWKASVLPPQNPDR